MTIERIELEETPATWRYLCDDGQLVDVTAHDGNASRSAALKYFEAHTERPRPEKKGGPLWVRIEGSALVVRATVMVPGPQQSLGLEEDEK